MQARTPGCHAKHRPFLPPETQSCLCFRAEGRQLHLSTGSWCTSLTFCVQLIHLENENKTYILHRPAVKTESCSWRKSGHSLGNTTFLHFNILCAAVSSLTTFPTTLGCSMSDSFSS